MKFEKLVNSPFFHFFNLLYKFILFNMLFLLTLILGLGIFSYMLGFIILVLAIKSIRDGKDFSIVKTWMKNIKKYFIKAFQLSIFYTLIGALFAFNTMFFYLNIQTDATMFTMISYYLFLILDVIVLFASIHSAFIFVYFPNLNLKKNIKYSFQLIQLIPLQTILMIGLLILTVFWLYIFPHILIFGWFAVIIFLFNETITKQYSRIRLDGINSLDITDV